MLNRICATFATIALLVSSNIQAQNDPVLFKVNNKEVKISEFQYIYNKTNGEKADYSEKSLKEYLDLYVNFKLQVAEGVDIGLSEKPEVKREQDQYKRQLASTYLTDREITEKLVREAYERSKEDRKISHILIAADQNMDAKAKREAFERAKKIKGELTPQNFNELAKQYSDDQYSNTKGGNLGYFTTLQLPYPLETAMYNTKKGEFSEIVTSQYGYHILRVDDVRPAFGRIKVAHILLRTKKDPKGAKVAIDSLYEVLKGGAKFEELASKHSQDNATKNRGGQLGWVGINKYAQDFEEAIFSLEQDGNVSKPIETEAGWHILKRYQGIKNPKYQDVKSEITNKIKRKPRFQIIQDALVADIKKEGGYKENEAIKGALVEALKKNNTFLTYKWKAEKDESLENKELFTIGNVKGTIREFMSIAQRAHSERMNQQPRTIEAAVDRIIKKLATQKCLAYEETQLDKRYPEFKALMREYEEGILLFEVKKQLVWDKASSDEEGLKAFYEANKNNYKWKQRANVTFYTLRTDDKKMIKKIQSKSKKKSAESVKSMFNKDREIVQTTSGIYEEGKNMELDKLKWKAGVLSKGYEKDGSFYFTKIEEIMSPSVKTLEEARGYVVADYQDNLEQDLIKKLKEKFKVEINDKVLKSMVK
ncbi:peptidylprolyl isomerase [Aureispira anguillae]|uniref:Peptidylprolyl isomerase n=1 Tax=Aureispira anguillae TaxID=2864201 RepID=A0A915YI29_9BACT|nr:peptidylprolyl isomerase [Aureispira anguillae]BDS13574.1 peptidylprolyl isomerase [Aureispira anguillae]